MPAAVVVPLFVLILLTEEVGDAETGDAGGSVELLEQDPSLLPSDPDGPSQGGLGAGPPQFGDTVARHAAADAEGPRIRRARLNAPAEAHGVFPPASAASARDNAASTMFSLSAVPRRSYMCRRRQIINSGDRARPSGAAAASTADARLALDVHLASSLEGAVSLRATGGARAAFERHMLLLDAHAAAWARAHLVLWQRQLIGALLGGALFLASGVMVLALRIGGGTVDATHSHYGTGITSSEAGYVLLQGCYASICTALILQRFAALEALGRARGAVMWGLTGLPQEASGDDTDGAAARTAEVDALYGPLREAMAPPPPPSPPGSSPDAVIVKAEGGRPRDPPADWPTQGHLVVRALNARYDGSNGSEGGVRLALSSVSLEVPPGAWVSLVGRTGAGKSSLLAAILRVIEPCGGSVSIDGVDAATVPLRTLRRRVVSVPQDPVLLGGTLRHNLDPFDEHTDAALLEALRLVGWARLASPLPRHLSSRGREAEDPGSVPGAPSAADEPDASRPPSEADSLLPLRCSSEGGRSVMASAEAQTQSDGVREDPTLDLSCELLSRWQRQQLALARALLARPRLLLLDEAFGSLSIEAASVARRNIRAALRRAAGGSPCSVLAVTHRLEAAADADWVVVLDAGEVAEQGPPAELLGRAAAPDGRATLRGFWEALSSEDERARVLRVAAAAAAVAPGRS